ncbi:MAG: hypothetical protein Q7S68_05075 [Deltaproteobacteria bacterium]|nr:hypothetical protein [Deltaproteobacteria bacterium]
MKKKKVIRWSLVLFVVSVSLVWAGFGSAQERGKEGVAICQDYGSLDAWTASHPTVQSWYHFYVNHQDCVIDVADFFKILASSESLSTKLAQEKVTFENFYIPLSYLLSVNFEAVGADEAQEVHANLDLIEQSLSRAMVHLHDQDKKFLRAIVLLGEETEFVEGRTLDFDEVKIASRLNRYKAEPKGQLQIHPEEVAAHPYERMFAIQ